ncbi:hypothetical protein B0H19DRAFT_1174817 [Mycena capillaripes]|nr:hypothetical protein B0H19DRAFT_1174817 [Mycena capillaripes]
MDTAIVFAIAVCITTSLYLFIRFSTASTRTLLTEVKQELDARLDNLDTKLQELINGIGALQNSIREIFQFCAFFGE